MLDSVLVRFVNTFSGDGDLHGSNYDEYARSITLSGAGVAGATLKEYVLTLYPDDEFFSSYQTSSPRIASIGAVVIALSISLIFMIYDRAVSVPSVRFNLQVDRQPSHLHPLLCAQLRREFSDGLQLLHAKRKFVRFISHEVRTPLNAVSGIHFCLLWRCRSGAACISQCQLST